jgi:flagellar basal body-associated protein FliL
MADEEPKSEETQEAGEPKSKKKLFVTGGVIGGLAVAFVAAMMGVPGSDEEKQLEGPFVAPLTPEKVQVNLTKSKSFLILDMNITYDAYEEAYFTARSAEPLTTAEIKSALVALASSKTREDVSDPVNKPVFMEEIRAAVDPLIFPIHVGDAQTPTDSDSASGVRPGFSAHLGTFRGEYQQHVLHVDAPNLTVRVDEGPVMKFAGHETDLEVFTSDDLVLYLDVSSLNEGFVGNVPIGVMGRVRRVLWNEILIQ